MWFDPDLAGLFITSTLLHLEEDINLLVVSIGSSVRGPPILSQQSVVGVGLKMPSLVRRDRIHITSAVVLATA
jgi:hypothetical protein